MRIPTIQLLQFAGLFTWAVLGLALILSDLIFSVDLETSKYYLWAVSHVTFGIAYWLLVTALGPISVSGIISLRRILLICMLIVSSLAISYASTTGMGGFLLLVVAGILPWCMPLSAGVALLIISNLLLALVFYSNPRLNISQALLFSSIYLGFKCFVYVLSMVARRQSRDRDELRQVNSELRATQVLLGDSVRIAERLRISRELHDLVGHHLTGLSLNLEVASHLVKGKALEHVNQALSVARLLLGDVREVVGSMRSGDQINISGALEKLIDDVPHPRIHLELPDEFVTTDPQRAQVIVRCAQEIITNTVKHAEADNLWLSITLDDDGLNLNAHDDGQGSQDMAIGNGLTGMRERLRQIGGKLKVESNPGEGFHIDAWLPSEVVI